MTLPRGKYVLLRTMSAAVALQVAACVSALACDGQVGKVIFEDTFTDDSGGWDLTPPEALIKPPYFLVAPDTKDTGIASLNLTFQATDGDYCLEAIFPPTTAANGAKGIGIIVYATDYRNFLEPELGSDGSVAMYSRRSGNWNTIFSVPAGPAFKAEPGAVNALRVVAKNGTMTIFVNGTKIKAVRAQVPAGNLSFGLDGEFLDSNKAVDGSPPIQVTSFKVTAGE